MSGLRTVYTGIAGLGTVRVLSPCGCQLGCPMISKCAKCSHLNLGLPVGCHTERKADWAGYQQPLLLVLCMPCATLLGWPPSPH